MPRKNKFFVFVIFSAIIMLIFNSCGQKKGGSAKAQAKANAPARQGRGEPFVYNAHEKRNPFAPLVSADGRILEPPAKQKTAGGVYLEGIIYDPAGSSYAVINGEIVKAGEKAGDYQVLRIEPQKIILLKEGQEEALELKK